MRRKNRRLAGAPASGTGTGCLICTGCRRACQTVPNSEGLGRSAIGWGRHSARFAATPSVRWRLRDLATAAIVEKGPKLLTPIGFGFDRIARAASRHALVASAPRTRDEAD